MTNVELLENQTKEGIPIASLGAADTDRMARMEEIAQAVWGAPCEIGAVFGQVEHLPRPGQCVMSWHFTVQGRM